MRQIIPILTCLSVGVSIATADILVNTRLNPSETIAKETTVQLELRDHFQIYSDPGPVATFELYMPAQAGFTEINFVDGVLTEYTDETPADIAFMTYQQTSGEVYTNAFDAYSENFVWGSSSVQYQLLASEAPGTVANFMTYVNDGVFANTIVHRSEINVLQAGGLRLHDTEEFLLEYIDTMVPIAFEETRQNTQGTLSMARQATLDSATSQFFINLVDNSGFFGSAYSVFGELIAPETNLPLLQEMGDTYVYDTTGVFPQAPFRNIPMYTPYWDDKGSYVRFPTITVNEGNPDGVTYGWEFVDIDGEEGVSDEEAANRAVFNISIDGSGLNISRSDTGFSRIQVTGTGAAESRSFEFNLIAYNPAALEAFPTSNIYQGGWIENSWFGWLVADDYPEIQHLNHGYQYVLRTVDDSALQADFYLYDYQLGSWLYTRSTTYPFLYAYALNTWVWYQLDSGTGSGNNRWFYNYATGEWFNG